MKDKYTTKNIQVSPDSLLFDPLNYRLWTSRTEVEGFKTTSLDHDDVQEKVFFELIANNKSNSHGIDELAKSINESGFIQLATIFVVKYKSKYLVVEGNRRLAAIRKLQKSNSLSPLASKSISKLPVTLIKCEEGADERAIINHIISIHQFAGPKQWGAMQQAYYAYDTYMKHFIREYRSEGFKYENDIAKKVSAELHLSVPQVKRLLKVSSTYQNLMERGYIVEVYHYSIIDETVSKEKFSQEYFEFDKEKFKFSDKGSALFYSMCLDSEDRPVNEPKKVSWIYKMYTKGYYNLLDKVMNRSVTLEEANEAMKLSEVRYRFSDSLERATKILKEIKPCDFNGDTVQINALKKLLRTTDTIKKMVDELDNSKDS